MERLGPMEKPAPYLVADRKEWIVSEEEANFGFAIYVRTGISNEEQEWLQDQHKAIVAYQNGEWQALPPEERDLAFSPRQRELALIAPHIHDWNARGFLRDGTVADIPPPAVAGVDAFACVEEVDKQFCTRVVLNGYLYLGKAVDLRRRSSASGDPSEPATDPVTPKPKSSRRRKT